MPWNRKLYPKNWDAIALAIKEQAGWNCQQCGRPCRKPKEKDWELIDRVEADPRWAPDLTQVVDSDEFGEVEVHKLGRFTLTVAHLNHRPEDCRPENLKALCSVCHCRMDLKAIPLKRQIKAERLGQLTLFGGGDDAA